MKAAPTPANFYLVLLAITTTTLAICSLGYWAVLVILSPYGPPAAAVLAFVAFASGILRLTRNIGRTKPFLFELDSCHMV